MPPRSLSYDADRACVRIIDQTLLPAQLHWRELVAVDDFFEAIAGMQVRGAPLIGICAAYGLALALLRDPSLHNLQQCQARLSAARPTAVNLDWALRRLAQRVAALPEAERGEQALLEAHTLAEEDVSNCRRIGEQGLPLLQQLALAKAGGKVQVLTHCNAGSLATLEWGTALAPLYLAHAAGLSIHVWVSETRPRNQGALTAWELAQAGIPHTLVTDSAAGHLMQSGEVDCCIVGSDRTAVNGDVCNKIGTYPKALVARDCGIPFYVALPLSSIDWDCASGAGIPVEHRSGDELRLITGQDASGATVTVRQWTVDQACFNPAFDITPAALIEGLITEVGIVAANKQAIDAIRPFWA
jgi:methylthioribose-1-phosphate isomerase